MNEELVETMSSLGERALIARLRSRIAETPGVKVGIGDDCALVDTPSASLLTTDTLVEGVHFDRLLSPARLLGRKALSINLSDVGAMSGVPRYALVNLCVPPNCPVDFVDGLYDGLIERAAEVGVGIVGGNLSATTGPIVVAVTLLGVGDRAILRRGVQVGDLVVITGGLGAAAEGLRLLHEGGSGSPTTAWSLTPESGPPIPRVPSRAARAHTWTPPRPLPSLAPSLKLQARSGP